MDTSSDIIYIFSDAISQISKIGPIVSVRDGLEPWSYLYDKAVTLGDDGWVYKWEEPIQPWFVTLTKSWGRDARVEGVYRRDKIDLRRIEAARWKLLNYMPKVVEKTLAATKALKKLDRPYYVKNGRKVCLHLSTSYYQPEVGYDVREETVKEPEGIVEQIALLPVTDDPNYTGGARWRALADWSGDWWNQTVKLNTLFEIVAMDMIHRKLGDKFRQERFSPRVVLQVNGRSYTFESPNRTKDSHTSWPHPSDIHIDVDTMEPLKNRFHQAGRKFDAPFKKPKRRSKRAAS